MRQKASKGEDFFINTADNRLPDNLTVNTLKNSKSLEFHLTLPNYDPTPLKLLKNLGGRLGVGDLYVKDEASRLGLNAFKVLGASYAIHQILKGRSRIKTFCTATDGNHGRAVAWSAKREGKESRIFVPAYTSQSQIRAIEDEGAIVTKIEGNYDETSGYALGASQINGWELVQDSSWEGYEEIPALIMAGYTTMFKEMESSVNSLPEPAVDIVFLQAGVGSFAASAIWYYLNRYGDKRPVIVIVEPSESDGILESFKCGKRSLPKGSFRTIMAGLNCGIPSKSAWDIISCGADAALRIDDTHTLKAMKWLDNPSGNDERVEAGESGAAGLAGLMRILDDPEFESLKRHLDLSERSRVLLFNTEGCLNVRYPNSRTREEKT